MTVNIGDIIRFKEAIFNSERPAGERVLFKRIYDPLWWSHVLESDDDKLLQHRTLVEFIANENSASIVHSSNKLQALTHYLTDGSVSALEELTIDGGRLAVLPVDVNSLTSLITTDSYALYTSKTNGNTIIFYDALQRNIFPPGYRENVRNVFNNVETLSRRTRQKLPHVVKLVESSLGDAIFMRTLLELSGKGELEYILMKVEEAYDKLNLTTIHNNASVNTVYLLSGENEIGFLNFTKSFSVKSATDYIRAERQNWLARAPRNPSYYRWDLLCFYVSLLFFYRKLKQEDMRTIVYNKFLSVFSDILEFEDAMFSLYDKYANDRLMVDLESDAPRSFWENSFYTTDLDITAGDESSSSSSSEGPSLITLSLSTLCLEELEVDSFGDRQKTLPSSISPVMETTASYLDADRKRLFKFVIVDDGKQLNHDAHEEAARLGFAPKILQHVFFNNGECIKRVNGVSQYPEDVDVLVTQAYNHTLRDVLSNTAISVETALEILEGVFKMLESLPMMNNRAFIDNVIVTTHSPLAVDDTVKRRYYLLNDYSRTWKEGEDIRRYETGELNNFGPTMQSNLYDRLCLIVSISRYIVLEGDDFDDDNIFKARIFTFLSRELDKLMESSTDVRVERQSILSNILYREGQSVLVIPDFDMFGIERREVEEQN